LSLLRKINMVVAGQSGPGSGALLERQCGRLINFQYEGQETRFKRASATRERLQSPSSGPNVSFGVIAGHYPVGFEASPDFI
jgi:hypothetical protein